MRPVLTLLLATALSGCMDSAPPAAGAQEGRVQFAAAQQSTNWSGYVLTGAPLGFSSVAGSWVVPAIQCGPGQSSSSSTWVGIGGGASEDPTLVQAGTVQDCSDTASYSAWWEIIPAPSVTASRVPLVGADYEVQPGDHISVTVAVSEGALWSLTIVNAERNWTFTTTVPYVAAGITAEWIQEAPLTAGSSGAGQSALANYGRVSFSALSVNGAAPALGPQASMEMVDANGAVISSPSEPTAAGDGFDVCFGAGPCALAPRQPPQTLR